MRLPNLRATFRRWLRPPPSLEIEPMADNDQQAIATHLRKIAQRIADGDYAAIAIVFVGPDGVPINTAQSRGPAPGACLIGGLFALAQDHHATRKEIDARNRMQAAAVSSIVKPSGEAIRAIRRGKGEN